MGFDISGINATTEKGEYFRNNCWWWRRLWDLCVSVGKMNDKDTQAGCYNNGDKIGKKTHDRLLKGLKDAYANRESPEFVAWVKKGDEEYCKEIGNEIKPDGTSAPSHPFTWDNVAEFIEFLEGNEGFEVY